MPTSHISKTKAKSEEGSTKYSSEFKLVRKKFLEIDLGSQRDRKKKTKSTVNKPSKYAEFKMSQKKISEWLPKKGQVYQEDMPTVVLCKPKLLPLKSVTLEKMEKMQREAQEQVKEQDKQERLNDEQNFDQYS